MELSFSDTFDVFSTWRDTIYDLWLAIWTLEVIKYIILSAIENNVRVSNNKQLADALIQI